MKKFFYFALLGLILTLGSNIKADEISFITDSSIQMVDDELDLDALLENIDTDELSDDDKKTFRQSFADKSELIKLIASAAYEDVKESMYPGVEELSFIQKSKVSAVAAKQVSGLILSIAQNKIDPLKSKVVVHIGKHKKIYLSGAIFASGATIYLFRNKLLKVIPSKC